MGKQLVSFFLFKLCFSLKKTIVIGTFEIIKRSRGIRNRLDYRVAGMFTQIGPLYYVHHLWAYKSLADRKASREKMWDKPGWDECVAYTVPLIRKMESRMMTALPFSPTQ